MKAVVLCAGYATRLYPLTLNNPKHLLPVAGRPMIEFLVSKLINSRYIDEIYILTNQKFFGKFSEWKNLFESSVNLKLMKKIEVISDGSFSEEDKLGAVGDMRFAIHKLKIKDDLLIVAGDNIIDFDLDDFITFFFEKKNPCIAVREIQDKELQKMYSEVRIDGESKVIYFKEKPSEPVSNLFAICLYAFPSHTLHFVDEYIREGNNPDHAGAYIEWLYKKVDVFAFKFSGIWYDIGTPEEYKKADAFFKEKLK